MHRCLSPTELESLGLGLYICCAATVENTAVDGHSWE